MEKFNYEPNGYNKKEVNNFVSEVIKNTEKVIDNCEEQKKEIANLKEKLKYYEKIEIELKSSLTKAEINAENIKKMAQKEAEIIIEEAKENASRIINESLLSAQKTENRKELIEKNMQLFKKKLKILLEQQKIVVDELDELELSDI